MANPTDPPFAMDTFRILIVDDNHSIHEDFRKVLARPRAATALDALARDVFGDESPEVEPAATFALDFASQGADAVEMVRASVASGSPYALAFVDVRMPPGLDGVETISLMWQVDPAIQAVICSAYSDHSWRDITRALGYGDGLLVLRKPFEAIEVMQMAHALARKWALSAEVKRHVVDLESQVVARTEDLERLATHDSLTGLPNRVLLHDRLIGAAARARRNRGRFAVMMLDLDHFKEVNDSFGHDVGDELLREVARRLGTCVRGCDTVTRLGGDEFVVLLEEIDEPEAAAIVAGRIVTALAEPIRARDHVLHTAVSIGIAVFPTDCVEPEALLKSADLAMYQAKEKGRGGYHYYAETMLASSRQKMEVRGLLGQALANGELELHYQPLIDIGTGRVAAMEALLRWQSPQLGAVSPLAFLPVAEQSGAILKIGEWVLRTACAQLAAWRNAGRRDLGVCVNISARQLTAPQFVDTVLRALGDAGLPASALELELTESAALADDERGPEVLARLARAGIRLAIDDFGSGYSSFQRIKSLPIHALKIDRSLVHNVASDPRDAAIFTTIVCMAHALGLTVVAEGVETEAQLEALRTVEWDRDPRPRCDRVQGYVFSRPMPAAEATALLRAGADAPSSEPVLRAHDAQPAVTSGRPS